MIVAILTAVAGLLIGFLIALARMVGCRQGRADVLAVARTLGARRAQEGDR
jgi:hypothetical protein